VFQAAPGPVVAFIATVSKGAIFALLLRYAPIVALHRSGGLLNAVTVICVLSMVAGNLLALKQRSIRRLLAYSSIAHMGYLLVALLASGVQGTSAAGFYLVVYFLATLGVFGVVVLNTGGEGRADDLEDFRGLAFRRPGLAAVMTIGMLSLAGLPVSGGFLGKFYILRAGVWRGMFALSGVLIGASVMGLFYYLRVVAGLFASERRKGQFAVSSGGARSASGVLIGLLVAALTVLGVYPGPLVRLIVAAIGGGPGF
jgi:NADH-quinone oxidoreductase subunit N